ncbi:MAG: CPBP family intramembrane metalloprotease [Rhodococcus sp.]|nr:CPBP family intramembrane metalloprotease [Rhodococcus sp. (in: high G+C Gram-positive bacteria)]
MNRIGSIALAAALVGWSNVVLPRLESSSRCRTLVNGAVGVGLTAMAARRYRPGELGLAPRDLPRGVRVGAVASALPAAGFLIAAGIPAVRSRFRSSRPREDFFEWVVVHIPIGTVLAEELMFRSVLSAVLRSAWPEKQALAIHAVTFGLWHVHPARAAGDNILGTVAFTGAVAALFEALRARGNGVIAPALLHLTVNVGGAVLTRAAAVDWIYASPPTR